MRKPVIGGNWKMNLSGDDARALAEGIIREVGNVESVDVVICPPFTSLHIVGNALENSRVLLGAQNMYWEESGAYTGEVSPAMLLTSGCKFVILGHSERRTYFGETNNQVNRKLAAALDAGLTSIVCIGETEKERKGGLTEKVLTEQVTECFAEISPEKMASLIIAYEPVWAIGTGLTATPEQAQDAHRFIRGLIEEKFGREVSGKVRIQYGGSMKPDNCRDILHKPDVDGGLIGGASLKVDDFAVIVRAAAETT